MQKKSSYHLLVEVVELVSNVSLMSLQEVVKHLFKKPGKKLRPALVLLSARMMGTVSPEQRETLIYMAAAVELIHSASLIHDDIIDGAEDRRNTATLNKQFNNTIAVLTGDILYAQFFSVLTNLPNVDDQVKVSLFDLFTKLARNMCIGEIFQHQMVNRYIEPNIKDYLKVLENKTALLMSASCKCGALLNGSSEKESEYMAYFGLNFGLAYQLVDDYIDHDSPVSVDADLMVKAEQYIIQAKEALSAVSKNGSGRNLENLCDFVIERAANYSRIAIENG